MQKLIACAASRNFLAGILVLYLLSRTFLVFWLAPEKTDLTLYSGFAWVHEHARSIGHDFYAVNAEAWGPDAKHAFTYPPLALWWIVLPNLTVRSSKLRPHNPDQQAFDSYSAEYKRHFRLISSCLEAACLVLLLVASRRLKPDLAATARSEMAVFVCLAGLAMGYTLYDRLDIAMATLVLVAFLCLGLNRHYLWAFAFLAAAINFKLVPVLLVPVWIVGAMPKDSLSPNLNAGLVLRDVTLRLVVFLGVTLVQLVPFYVMSGPRAFDYLTYHATRDIQVESTYATMISWAEMLGATRMTTEHGYGSVNIDSPWSSALATLSTPLMITGLTLTFVFFLVVLWKRMSSEAANPPVNAPTTRRRKVRGSSSAGTQAQEKFVAQPASQSVTLAMAYPWVFLMCTQLILLTGLLLSKVFSPQYMIWLIPLCALSFFDHTRYRYSPWLCLAVCGMTGLIYPVFYNHITSGALSGTLLH